jgi:hypothetical protein
VPPSATASELNGSPLPSPFGFRQPGEEETSSLGTIPNPASSPEETTLPADELGQDSGDDWLHDDESPFSTEDTSSTASATRGAASNPLNGEGLRDTITNALVIAGHQAHNLAGSRTEGQRAVGLYVMEREDAEPIAEPLSRIAQRNATIGKVSPDTADALAAMMALAGFATKQIEKSQQARRLDQAMTAGQVVPDGAGEAVQ